MTDSLPSLISNETFFKTYDPSGYRNPPVAVDVILVDPELRVKLITRQNPPDHLKRGLPGSFVVPGEPLLTTCRRAVERYTPEVDAESIHPVQMHVFDGRGRDIRDRVLSIAHLASVSTLHPDWESLEGSLLQDLAFDHARMLLHVVGFLRKRVWDPEVMQGFLPEQFPVKAYCGVASNIMRTELNPSNFRKKAIARKIIQPLTSVSRGKTALYEFI